MPYQGEFATSRSVQRIVASERVQALLGRQRQVLAGDDDGSGYSLLDPMPASDWTPDWILAIDGSHLPVPVQNGYPIAEVGYITVASVLIDVARIQELDAERPADPRRFRETERPESIDAALPGANVVIDAEESAVHSLRRALFDVVSDTRMASDGETLLDTYEVLLASKPDSHQLCPFEQDQACDDPERLYRVGDGEYDCSCPLARPLFSTDAMRIHEGMSSDGPNGAMFAEIMQVWERVWLVNILRTLESKGWLASLRRLAIVVDGPLAVFGHPAWLSHAIRNELIRINEAARHVNEGQDILLVGIEKTGLFVDHLMRLDTSREGTPGGFPEGGTVLLTDQYIRRHIQPSVTGKQHGRDTYFGRKIFHKTPSGALIVASLPHLSNDHRDLSTADVDQFPRLGDAVRLLDAAVSTRYPNSLAPIVAAHAEAAIPLHLGQQVLERLAREIVGDAG